MLRTTLVVAAALAAIAALAGCGGGEPQARAADRRIEIALDDFRYRPQSIRARPGRLTIELVNRGRLPHNFVIRGRTIVKVPSLMPGERTTITRRFRQRGGYRFFCSLANHEELGMYGTLTVR